MHQTDDLLIRKKWKLHLCLWIPLCLYPHIWISWIRNCFSRRLSRSESSCSSCRTKCTVPCPRQNRLSMTWWSHVLFAYTDGTGYCVRTTTSFQKTRSQCGLCWQTTRITYSRLLRWDTHWDCTPRSPSTWWSWNSCQASRLYFVELSKEHCLEDMCCWPYITFARRD